MVRFIIISFCVLFLGNCVDKTSSNNATIITQEDVYIEKGQKIAMSTFTALSSNLQLAMKDGGVPNAIRYCNLAASPIVDSLEQLNNATIKRTSLKVRNPNNKPTYREQEQLLKYQQQFNAKENLQPVVDKANDQLTYYAPIHMMPLCENCHGKVGGKIAIEDYETIQNLYPGDKAINYGSGDLRGMWSITFHDK